MSTQITTSSFTQIGQTVRQYSWLIGLCLFLAASTLVAYRAISVSPLSPSVSSGRPTSEVHPKVKPILEYLQPQRWSRVGLPPNSELTPAQQSVMDYLSAHGVDQPRSRPAPWNQAVQAVLDYLQAHN
jgi:hypothetical protein